MMRDGQMIMVDDDRMPLSPARSREMQHDPLPHARLLSPDRRHRIAAPRRFSTSSRRCWSTTSSERQGRVIDKDQAASMEKKKQEGYF